MKRREFLKGLGLAGAAAAMGVPVSCASGKEAARNFPVKRGGLWDVIVAGGGPAGCAAAIAAARHGAKTLLLEATGMLGGMGTAGLLNAWCPFTDGESFVYRGIAEEIFLSSKAGVPHVKGNDWVPINSEHLKRVYDSAVVESGACVLLFSTVAAVEMADDGRVDALIVANKAGLTAYRAKVFVDCTGDGDIATWAGASFMLGDENGKVQSGSLCFTLAGVDMASYRPGSLHSNNPSSPIHDIVADPEFPLVNDAHMNDKLPFQGVTGFNSGHIDVQSTDPASLTAAIMEGRKMADQIHRGLKKHAPAAFANSYLAETAPLMGIREGRRIECDYTFTLQDWLDRRDFPDSIGRNNYYIDVHKANSTKYPRYGKGETHGIPFSCMLPRGLGNVIVAGRCISTDPYAYGSLRVMPPSLVTGQAAGTAAAMFRKASSADVHNLDTAALRKTLTADGQRI